MKSRLRLLFLSAFLFSGLGLRAQFTWNGLAGDNDVATGGNWVGGVAPTGASGLDDLIFAAPDMHTPTFNSAFSVRDITLVAGAGSYNLGGTGQLTLKGNVTTQVGSQDGAMLFGMPLTLAAGTHTFTMGGLVAGPNGEDVILFSQIGGTGNVVKVGLNSLVFDHASNTFTGYIDLQQGNLLVHGDGTLGTGLLKLNGGRLVAVDYYNDSHITVLNNNVSLSSNSRIGTSGGNGSITINGTATAQAGVANVQLRVRGNGVLTLGNVAETDPLTHFEFAGDGFTRITGTASYTGGTLVDDGVRVIFATGAPAVGLLQTESDGYLGTEVTAGIQAGFINRFDVANTYGVIGFDSPNVNSPQTFAGPIDLTGFDSGVRLGTLTSAILSGTITPQSSDYLFGGTGTLTVNSNLSDVAGSSEVQVLEGGLVYLQGNNTYTGETEAFSGAIIFTGANSIPAAPDLYSDFRGYIGQTETANGARTADQYFALFYTPDTFGIVGFDADNPVVGRVVSDNMDFSVFDHDAYLGTATKVTFTGSINPFNNTYRFSAFRDGQLTVNSVLSGARSAIIGIDPNFITSVPPRGQTFSPSVTLNGANSYTGGTTLQSGRLILGNNTALGTGPLTIDTYFHDVSGQPPGLTTNTPGLVIANDIIFNSSHNFYIGGANDFTLAGDFTSLVGEGLEKVSSNTITLSGDNSGLLGNITVTNGTLNLFNDNAAGLGTVYLDSSSAALVFNTPTPILYGLNGSSGSVTLPGGTNLTLDISDAITHDSDYGGLISGAGNISVITPTAPAANILNLSGNNTSYTGNISVSGNYSVLSLSNNSAGSGSVSVNAPSGGLLLNSGANFANPLTFTAGTLGGLGTFNTGAITLGAGQTVMPGFGTFSTTSPVGTLTFNSSLTFANGGTYAWGATDVNAASGTSLLNLTGNLTITATTGGFNFVIRSFDASGNPGFANFTEYQSYSINVLHATGGISGFDPTSFTIDDSQFFGGTASGFFLTQSGNDLFLNFTAVPEPSTYVLISLGLGAVLFPTLRRRKRV